MRSAVVLGALALSIMSPAFGLAALGCTVDYKCESCNVKLDVPLPDCVIYGPGNEIRACPKDAGDEATDGAE